MSNGRVARRNIDSLRPEELAQLRDGYARMQAISDNRGFNAIAGVHGNPGNYCRHGDRTFLPWHRAYLYEFEQYLKDHGATLAVPWWDWSRSGGVPRAFSAPTRSTGAPNSLLRSRIRILSGRTPLDRDTRRFPGTTSLRLPTPTEIADLLRISDFADFSRQLEGIHNRIHVWTGGSGRDPVTGRQIPGDMAEVPTAAYDPIFFSHHAMIDRLWYLWQLRYGINNIPSDLLNQPLPPFRFRVSDVLDIRTLGYDYAVDRITVSGGG
jgi:tyrosinase